MAFFRIKEAAEKVGVLPHVLRFWESQFPSLKPNKTSRGQRLYSEEDIENFLKIKHLLYTEGYSIPGAKKVLKESKKGAGASGAGATSQSSFQTSFDERIANEVLEEALTELKQIHRLAKEI